VAFVAIAKNRQKSPQKQSKGWRQDMNPALIPFFLLVVPVVEIAVFIVIGGKIGIAATLGLILVTAIIGSILLRVQGLATLQRIRQAMEKGRLPGRELGNGAMILVAGVLLLTPGFVTDAIGFALFVPALRDSLWRFLSSRVIPLNADPDRPGASGPEPEERVVDLNPGEFGERPNPNSPWGGAEEKR
jgi:UPF0716 protein FxsA